MFNDFNASTGLLKKGSLQGIIEADIMQLKKIAIKIYNTQKINKYINLELIVPS